MLIKLHDKNPSERDLRRIVEVLERDGVVIYPTDSLYAYGCSLRSPRAIERLRRIKGKQADELAVVFADIAQAAEYCRVDNAAYRLLRRNLPGPFTFLVPASSRTSDKALGKRRTVGMRIPGHAVARALVEALGAPLLTTSLTPDAETEYTTDPELIHERLGRTVEAVVDGGQGSTEPTTVVDLTGDEPAIVRQGRGELQ